ncbi:uncharacterized protein AC631_05832 [Debaryomyces fabryi]|uniref:CTP-dependent diacylglycerol kinase 1 n=1 Tax=Debaryomyces fabryi TaxID=58627 RepID=A0A0V1PQS7_9ASCO|nr:uncharacterized protein AC631_05832 [Debaryomyces fabryi]KRZ98411.1 hypothetical protein AC631_05832 [Debaryomyces fabryi]
MTSVAPITSNLQFRHKLVKDEKTFYNIKSKKFESDVSEDSSEEEQVIEYVDEGGVFIQESPKGEKSFMKKHEIPRKAFHSFTGFFTLWLYVNGYNQRQLVQPMSLMAITCFMQDFIRFRVPSVNNKLIKLYSSMMRESEQNSYNGILFFLIGIIITSSLLPKDICLMCNLLLSWGDTSASLIGREFGKYTPKLSANKSLAGSMASFATGVSCCYLMYGHMIPKYHYLVDLPNDIMWSPQTSTLNIHCFAIACGLISSISEFIDLWGMDDNFTIPVLSGSFLYTLVHAFKIQT